MNMDKDKILVELSFYLVNQREMARRIEIRTVLDRKENIIANQGMILAYNDVLDFLSKRGCSISSIRK